MSVTATVRRQEMRLHVAAVPADEALAELAVALERYPDVVERMMLGSILAWVPGLGPDRKRLVLRHVAATHATRFGHLTGRQRESLIAALRSPVLNEIGGPA